MAMADSYGLFWNSVNGDRKYDATSFEQWLKKFFCNGVFKDELKVSAYSGMTVKVASGYSNVNSKVGMFTTDTYITLDVANSIYPRIDTIVIERNNGNREITLHKVNGSYSGNNPQPPAPVRTGGIYQLVLAQIYVAAGASRIVAANITDTRANINLCGFVTGVVEGLSNVAKTGDYNDLSNKPNLAKVATTGDYNDLSNKPSSVNGVKVEDNLVQIGINAKSNSSRDIAIGTSATADGQGSIAIGSGLSPNNDYAAKAYGTNVISIGGGAGSNHSAAPKSDSISIGTLSNANAGFAIAMGSHAVATNTSALAIGDRANALANSSTAVGYLVNAKGNNSTALGYISESKGIGSTAVGAMAKTNALQASAFGYMANASGINSVALGFNSYSTGERSISISANASGINSTAIGYYANASAINSTAIGYKANATSANSIRLGDNYLSALQSAVNLTVTSDQRDKTDIKPIKDALPFINKLDVCQYVRNNRDRYMYPEDQLTEEEKEKRRKYELYKYDKEEHKKGTKKGTRKRVGLLAQEVQQALLDIYGSDNYANIVDDNLYDLDNIPEDVESMLRISYAGFVPFLIKAVQELDEKINKLNKD